MALLWTGWQRGFWAAPFLLGLGSLLDVGCIDAKGGDSGGSGGAGATGPATASTTGNGAAGSGATATTGTGGSGVGAMGAAGAASSSGTAGASSSGSGGAAGGGGSGGGPLVADCCPAGWSLEQDLCVPDDPCVDNSCPPNTCNPGRADCNGLPGDGCEAALSHPNHCGSCTNVCAPGQVCGPSGCTASCAPPLTNCFGSCVDLTSDADHCGQCITPCSAPENAVPQCNAATCGFTCAAGLTLCSGFCVNLKIDASNCGGCGVKCLAPKGGSARCIGGTLCVEACPSGYTHCGGAGGACVNTMSHPQHCGGCSVDCGTGLCVNGSCDSSLSEMAATAGKPGDLQVDDQNVYFVDETAGSIIRAGKLGGAPVTLAAGQAGPKRLVIDSAFVYWTNSLGGAVMRVPKAGGSAAVVAVASQPGAVAVGSADVFWVNETDDTIMKAPKDGSGTAALLWDNAFDVVNLAIDEPYLYWSEAFNSPLPTIWRIPASGGMPTSFGQSEFVLGLDADRVYMNGSDLGLNIVSVLKSTGGDPRQLVFYSVAGLTDLEVDDHYIYFVRTYVQKSSKCGRGIPVVTGGISVQPGRLALDQDYVYWSDQGAVRRASK